MFPVAPLARDVARRAERSGLERGCTVRVDVPDAPLFMEADTELVVRVLENLVGNAISHAHQSGVVTLAFRSGAAGRVLVEIIDQNSVIPEKERSSIFEPLQRGTTPSAHRRHGLGLAFCRLVIEAHHGRLGVRPNAKGDGNTFFFDLPAPRSARPRSEREAGAP